MGVGVPMAMTVVVVVSTPVVLMIV